MQIIKKEMNPSDVVILLFSSKPALLTYRQKRTSTLDLNLGRNSSPYNLQTKLNGRVTD